ncbi:uncharacterized protein LOC120821392 isoform X2 [Gasterosteus aculeatus]
MLQQILDDMFIDPDVLDALNDDQKKILFLKMRQEQVRRWTEREEKLESEAVDGERKRTAPKTANRKNVSWLPGRDGDVAVIVIGERDELNSKFIHSGFGEKSLQNNACHQTILKSRTTAPVAAERENTQPGISLNLKPEPKSASVTREEEPAPWRSISARLLGTPNAVDGRAASANPAPANPAPANPAPAILAPTNPAPANPAAAILAPTNPAPTNPAPTNPAPRCGHANLTPTPSPRGTARVDSTATGGGLRDGGPQKPQVSQSGKDVAASEAPRRAVPGGGGWSGNAAAACAGRGRVAQLMKTFSTESPGGPAQTPSPPRGVKPPLPNKPGHLRLKTTPTVR